MLVAPTSPETTRSFIEQVHQLDHQEAIQKILKYEKCGQYRRALLLAIEYLSELNYLKDIEELNLIIDRLKDKMLKLGSSRMLFNENQEPNEKLIELLNILGMNTLDQFSMTIDKINTWAQANLLRNGERWEVQSEKFEGLRDRITPLVVDLGLTDEDTCFFKDYQGALVHGSLLSRIRLRLHFLIEQWKKGVKFKQLVFLSSERPLEPLYENLDTFLDDSGSALKIKAGWKMPEILPSTECELFKMVWDQSEIPDEMRDELEVIYINAPMIWDPIKDKYLRPTTDETVLLWLASKPAFGRYIVVSNAPYTTRQDLVARTYASEEYEFDTIGTGCQISQKVILFTDELARLIYQTKQFIEKTSS